MTVYTNGMRRLRHMLVLALCVLVPLRTLAEPMACLTMPSMVSEVAAMSMSMPMSHDDCDPTAHDGTTPSERAAHCHCVALSGWSPLTLTAACDSRSDPPARRANGVVDRFVPHIWRPPAVDAASS